MTDSIVILLFVDHYNLGWMIVISLLIGLLYNKFVYFFIPFKKLIEYIFPPQSDVDLNNFPSGMLVIPSLLRDEYDVKEILAAVHSAAINNYPGELHIIAAIDGRSENLKQYNELVKRMNIIKFADNIHLHVVHNEVRRGKQMAINAAIQYMRGLVAKGKLACLPTIYFSFDADETMEDGSLRKLVERLMRRHPISKNYRTVVASQVCTPKADMWKGWKSFFTIAGQNYLWVATGQMGFSFMLENVNILPYQILPGQLFATWSEVLVQAPRLMGWLQTVKYTDAIRWWLGLGAPKFSDYTGESLPEGLCGNTDDTSVMVVLAMSHWKNGKLSWDPMPTPLHAFGKMLWNLFVERTSVYEPNAKVYSFTPPKLKGLWNQRKRWMANRSELNGRFFKSFFFYWSAAVPFYTNFLQIIIPGLNTVLFFAMVPYSVYLSGGSVFSSFVLAFLLSYVIGILGVLVIYIFEPKKEQFTHILLASLIPSTWLFGIVFFNLVMIVGTFEDVFLFGLNVKFYTSNTLIRSRAQRIAIAYRARRFLSMSWRSIRHGDVPFGWWWFGWYEKPEYGLTNGFTGWTKDNKSDYILR